MARAARSPIHEIVEAVAIARHYRRAGTACWRKDVGDAAVQVRVVWGSKGSGWRISLALGVCEQPAPLPEPRFVTVVDTSLDSYDRNGRIGVRDALRVSRHTLHGDLIAVIEKALAKVLPRLERLASQETFRSWYDKGEAPEPFVLWSSLARPALGLERQRRPLPPIDLPVIGKPRQRLNNAVFQRGAVSLLNVWHPAAKLALRQLPLLTAIKAMGAVKLYGVARHATEEATAAFLREHGNPYDLCAYGRWDGHVINGLMLLLDGQGRDVHFAINLWQQRKFDRTMLPEIERLRQEEGR